MMKSIVLKIYLDLQEMKYMLVMDFHLRKAADILIIIFSMTGIMNWSIMMFRMANLMNLNTQM